MSTVFLLGKDPSVVRGTGPRDARRFKFHVQLPRPVDLAPQDGGLSPPNFECRRSDAVYRDECHRFSRERRAVDSGSRCTWIHNVDA